MKGKINFQALLIAIILILAGILSPSNGVDDRSYKTPLELMTTMFIIIAAGLVAYFIWTLVQNHKKILKESPQQNKEK